MPYELNIEIVTVESVWDLPLHGESLNFSTSFYMLDPPLLDVNVKGFGEKLLGSLCRPLSSIFEDVTHSNKKKIERQVCRVLYSSGMSLTSVSPFSAKQS